MSDVVIDPQLVATVAAAVAQVLAAQTGATPAQAQEPTVDLSAEARAIIAQHGAAIQAIRAWTDAHVDREHTYRDLHVLLGLRDPMQARPAPAAPAAQAPVDWLDPVVVRVSRSGRPVNKSGAFIALERADWTQYARAQAK